MAYVRKRTDKERVQLLSLDPEGETWADIKHVRGKDQLKLDQVRTASEFSYKIDEDDVTERVPVPEYIIKARKVWIALLDTNILIPDPEAEPDDDDEPLTKKWFTPGLEWTEFMELWNEAEPIEHRALYNAVIEVNPNWGNW